MSIGLPTADLVVLMRTPEVEQSLQDDIEAGRSLGINSIPYIVINGKWVPRWKLEDQPRLDLILADER